MVKKGLILSLVILYAFYPASAQRQAGLTTLKLTSVSNVGLLNGSYGASVALQVILGASYKKSFVGVGAGIDYYRFRTVPVFADFRQYFGQGKRNVFVYGQIGYNFDWVTEKNLQNEAFFGGYNFNGGLYYDMGLGYKIDFGTHDALLLSLGYNVKELRNKEGNDICPLIGPCYMSTNTIDYKLPRLVIKAGWRF
jgi:hypothetical protein